MAESLDVRLYVKAGHDGIRYGACPFCQRTFMILLLKGDSIHFEVVTVNPSKPLDAYRQLGLKQLPALVHGDVSLDIVDDIVQQLDEVFPSPDLTYDNPDAENSCKNLFSKFCFFIKAVSKDPTQLVAELQKLNEHLLCSGYRFMCGDVMTHLDCELLPKLQHMRVASKFLKNFEIPTDLVGIWKYLYHAYSDPVFMKTCPSDQEIILHWAEKPETPNLTFEQHAQITKEGPRYSLDVPAMAQPISL